MAQQTKQFNYFSAPDGENVYAKLAHLMKPAAITATGLAISDVMLVSHPKGYLSTISRLVYVGSPFVGATAAFVLTTNGLASIRKKQDKWNWFAGGMCAGSVFGAWKRSVTIGFHFGVVIGLAAVLTKLANEKGWDLFPMDTPISHMVIWDPDWTLIKERPKNWVKSAAEATK